MPWIFDVFFFLHTFLFWLNMLEWCIIQEYFHFKLPLLYFVVHVIKIVVQIMQMTCSLGEIMSLGDNHEEDHCLWSISNLFNRDRNNHILLTQFHSIYVPVCPQSCPQLSSSVLTRMKPHSFVFFCSFTIVYYVLFSYHTLA